MRRRPNDELREGTLHGGLPYLAIGAGPTMVVFSGLSPENANPSGRLTRSIESGPLRPLADHFTVHLVNRRPGLPAGSTIADMARDYAAMIEHEFGRPVPVMGISTGGSIAQRFAIDHPRLLSRLVLVATACRLSPHGREVQRRLARDIEAGRPRRAWAGLGPALTARTVTGWFMTGLLWLVAPTMTPDDPSDLLTTIGAEDAFDVAAELDRIAVPTLLIAGERDRVYSPALFRETADGIPDARLELYAGKGHAGSVSHKPGSHEIVRFLTTGVGGGTRVVNQTGF